MTAVRCANPNGCPNLAERDASDLADELDADALDRSEEVAADV